MKATILSGLVFFLVLKCGHAQSGIAYSLQQCIDTALAHNVEVRQSALLTEAASINVKQSRADLLPDLNASINHGINQGRSIDPFTNGYVNQAINYAGYGVNSGVVLFSGLNLQNEIKRTGAAFDAARMELQQAKDNLTLNVILTYLLVLTNEDQLSSALAQKELSAKQLERLNILDSQGAVSPALVTDLKGQLINDRLSILDLTNSLESAKLSLAQLMNVPFGQKINVERIDVEEFLSAYTRSVTDVSKTALEQFSLVKSVELRKRSAAFGLKAARSLLYPSLVLSGALQTNYSSVAQNSTGKIAYSDQIKNNVFTSLNLGLRVPLLNAFRTRYTIRLADINLRNSELIEEGTKMSLAKDVQQAYLNMTTAFDRYKALNDQVEAYLVSFRAAEAKFNTGVGTSVDYLIAKNNYDRAKINLISSKYQFVLRKKVLDYYQHIGMGK